MQALVRIINTGSIAAIVALVFLSLNLAPLLCVCSFAMVRCKALGLFTLSTAQHKRTMTKDLDVTIDKPFIRFSVISFMWVKYLELQCINSEC